MKTLKKILLWVTLPCALLACSGGGDQPQQQSQGSSAFDVGVTLANTTLTDQNASFFAAARFLEQATFGYTLNDVKRVQSLGFAGWIDEQYALPATKIDMSPVCCYDVNLPFNSVIARYPANSVMDAMVSAPDQLRLRTCGLCKCMCLSIGPRCRHQARLRISTFCKTTRWVSTATSFAT